MGERSDFWLNVYREGDGSQRVGYPSPTRAVACQFVSQGLVSRLHVRLKPEGAPKRYASESERRAWEIDPTGARFAAQHGFSMRNRVGSGVYLMPTRTPKIEERT